MIDTQVPSQAMYAAGELISSKSYNRIAYYTDS